MKVVYICSTLEPSGPVNQLYQIVRNMDPHSFKSHIITLSSNPKNSRVQDFQRTGVETHSLHLSRVASAVLGVTKLKSKLDEIQPDILHSHGFRADIINTLTPINAYKVNTIHSYYYNHHPNKYGRILGSGLAWAHLYSIKQLDTAVACSNAVASDVAQHGISTCVIPNGVDIERFEPVSQDKTINSRSEIGLPSEPDIFLSVGSLTERKDPLTLIKGFSKWSKKDSRLVILSGGPLLKQCREMAADDPKVIVRGPVPTVDPYLKAADYFVSASQSEGLPMAVLEAISSGLPVCLSRIAPHEEILEYDPNAGTTFDVGSPKSVARSLENLSSASYRKQSQAARGIAENHLSATKMSSSYQELYCTSQK